MRSARIIKADYVERVVFGGGPRFRGSVSVTHENEGAS